MNFSKKTGKKKAAAAAVICFVAAIAITGTYTFNDYKKSLKEKELAKVEEIEDTAENEVAEPEETVDGEIVANEIADASEINQDEENPQLAVDKNNDVVENVDDVGTVENVATDYATSVNFTSTSQLLWPVDGIVLMDYSMDKTVYFKTLDQYKYNPAMIIAGAQGDQVIAGAAGIVKSIDNTAETGTTVNVDLGNGYEVFYGQLVSVLVKTGDYVEATTTLGYVAEPTKYYSSEGSNVYFEMRKDGQPVDPKEYLVE